MTEATNKLTRLQQRLVERFGTDVGLEVRLLPDHQMLISKNLVPNPALGQRGKTESFVPSLEGYEVYVSDRSMEDYWAKVSTSQRITGPSETPITWDVAMPLEVSPTLLNPEWRLMSPAGRVVTINVKSGSERVVDEVNPILAEIAATLLS
jgi:hypothetical protein